MNKGRVQDTADFIIFLDNGKLKPEDVAKLRSKINTKLLGLYIADAFNKAEKQKETLEHVALKAS